MENKMKNVTIICKKTESMVVSKRDSPRRELHNGDVKIKQIQKFSYLDNVVTVDRKWDTEIRQRIRIAKVTFQKISKVLRHRKISLKTTKKCSELVSNVLSSIL